MFYIRNKKVPFSLGSDLMLLVHYLDTYSIMLTGCYQFPLTYTCPGSDTCQTRVKRVQFHLTWPWHAMTPFRIKYIEILKTWSSSCPLPVTYKTRIWHWKYSSVCMYLHMMTCRFAIAIMILTQLLWLNNSTSTLIPVWIARKQRCNCQASLKLSLINYMIALDKINS